MYRAHLNKPVCAHCQTGAGALLAGLEQQEVAQALVDTFKQQERCKFLGVVFHSRESWLVMDLGGFVEPLATSPIKEHRAFVVFDEARCRCATWGTCTLILHLVAYDQVQVSCKQQALVKTMVLLCSALSEQVPWQRGVLLLLW